MPPFLQIPLITRTIANFASISSLHCGLTRAIITRAIPPHRYLRMSTSPPRSSVVGALACQRDSYLRTLDTEVVSCVPLEESPVETKSDTASTPNGVLKQWLVEFADSVLFPEGGGQPADHGTITPLSPEATPIPITSVQRDGLRCVHYSPTPLEPGTKVRQVVDFERRWDHMQQHTGQHLLSAIMDKYDGLNTLGWGMGRSKTKMSYVEIPRKPSPEEVREIQERCNEVIRDHLDITVQSDAGNNENGAEVHEEKGVMRIIKIGDVDADPCCGTHLKNTAHINVVLLHHTIPNGKNTRLFFSCGDRAINIATASIFSLRSIAGVLSSEHDPEEVLGGVKRLSDAAVDGKKRERKLLAEIAKYESERVKQLLDKGENTYVHRSEEGMEFINNVTAELKGVLKGLKKGAVVLVSGEKGKTGQVLVVGEKEGVMGLVEKVKTVLPDIKGGGGGGRWQGKVVEWKKGELEKLRKAVEM